MTTPPLTIRLATWDDREIALRLLAELGYPDLDREAFERAFAAALEREHVSVLLAERAPGDAVGLMTLSRRPQIRLSGEVLCIDELVVSAGARGQGAGGELLKYARSEFERSGCVRLEVQTSRSRENYRRGFYPKHGFYESLEAVMRIDAPSCPSAQI